MEAIIFPFIILSFFFLSECTCLLTRDWSLFAVCLLNKTRCKDHPHDQKYNNITTGMSWHSQKKHERGVLHHILPISSTTSIFFLNQMQSPDICLSLRPSTLAVCSLLQALGKDSSRPKKTSNTSKIHSKCRALSGKPMPAAKSCKFSEVLNRLH